MAPTIRIDDEVYAWLQKNAKPFEDTPNSVLRRIAGIAKTSSTIEPSKLIRNARSRELNGKRLNKKWGVGAKHALYHKDGHFYENLEHFPGAYFDIYGYILFKTEKEYMNCSYVSIGQKTNVPRGISSIPGYIKVES